MPQYYSSGACFSKVPKLFGPISGDIILFVSVQRRRLKARNFAIVFILFPLQHITEQLYGIGGSEFYERLLWPEKMSGLTKNEPQLTRREPGRSFLSLISYHDYSRFRRILRPGS